MHKLGFVVSEVNRQQGSKKGESSQALLHVEAICRRQLQTDLASKMLPFLRKDPDYHSSYDIDDDRLSCEERGIIFSYYFTTTSQEMFFYPGLQITSHMFTELVSPWYASKWQGRERLIHIKIQEMLGLTNARFQTEIDQNNIVTKLITRSDAGATVLAQAVATYHPNRELHTDDPDMQYYHDTGEYITPSYVLFRNMMILLADKTTIKRSQRRQITQIITQQLLKDVYDKGIVAEGRYFAGGPTNFWRQSVKA